MGMVFISLMMSKFFINFYRILKRNEIHPFGSEGGTMHSFKHSFQCDLKLCHVNLKVHDFMIHKVCLDS